MQITRNLRKDGSTTFGLRVRSGGADEVVPLGNSEDGWDEVRVETARKQLLARIELGLWVPGTDRGARAPDDEPTFRELATDWLRDRQLNPAIQPRTTELNETQLTRYLAPFFGELLPSQITTDAIKRYRRQIHDENAQIRAAQDAGNPLVDPRTGQRQRTLSNESINKTLRTLALVLDEAEDAGWIDRNPARGRRVREPLERRRRVGSLDLDELNSLLEAATQLDRTRHSPRTLERAEIVRALRDDVGLEWAAIAKKLRVARATAFNLYGCQQTGPEVVVGRRRAVIATLALAGPRVTELCQLDIQDVDLRKARFYVRDSKTEAGIRDVDIHGRLLSELQLYREQLGYGEMDEPMFPTRSGTRRNKDNVRLRVVDPVVRRANEIRAGNDQPPIHVHVTPHTFRRTYITYMLAAGHDIPYVQSQVGHLDPKVTLGVYAQLIRRPDRDQMREEVRSFLETPLHDAAPEPPHTSPRTPLTDNDQVRSTARIDGLRRVQKAAKGSKVIR
ncbi:MAG TPA: tyrosine-type recombinase/integrase [Solirubrobacteraceae bacterium]|nr:tyrosine-type recombinase/integrase [Solirubrobacteraceae bacterium]